MKRVFPLLLALCLVFTLLPFAASAEDTTAYVETEHFKVTVTMDPDDAVYNWSTAELGDYFNIPIEIGITAKAATTNLTVDEVEAALKGEEGSESLDNEYYNLLICFGNHYVAELSLIVAEKDKGQLVMYKYPDEFATPYETYSDSGKVVTEGEGVGPFKLYAAESQKDFPTSIDTGNVEGSISSSWGKQPEESEESVTVPKVPDENRIEVSYGEPIPTKDSAGITATIPISVKNTGYSSGSKCLAFYATYKDNNEDKNSTLGPLTLHFDYKNNELVLSDDRTTWVKEYETDEGITITFADTGEYEAKIYAVLLDSETEYFSFLANPESYIADITPSNVKVSVWEVKYAPGTDDSVTGMPEDTVVAGGGSVAPGDPSRENYVFKGWDSNDDGKVDYQPGAAIENISSDLTLKAVWALKEYTVSFDSAGGSAVAEQTVEHGKTVDKPADPTRAGYAFEGWYVGDAEYDFTQPVTSDLTLTAKWTEVHTVTLVYGRGAGQRRRDLYPARRADEAGLHLHGLEVLGRAHA